MAPKHTDPSSPRVDGNRSLWARAPYNFVPLPDKMVEAPPPVDQDSFYPAIGLTGWIDCELETCSPTYVRGMLTYEQFKAQEDTKTAELTVDQKIERAPFFSTSQEKKDGFPLPTIPGSSLRGMIRTLVEVIGYGRMRNVDNKPAFTFRAVAASKDDPLRDPYRDVIGAFGRNVKTGYLKQRGDKWFVHPALTPQEMNWPEQNAYLKVKEHQIGSQDIPNFIRMNSSGYRPQIHLVSFNIGFGQGKRGKYVAIRQIGKPGQYSSQGVLVCSGNMLETQATGQKSPRKNHALLLPASKTIKQLIPIDSQAVDDYLKSLTVFQKEELEDWSVGNGCLRDGAPVFYVEEKGKVVQFGHCPNFRVSARQTFGDKDRAATPLDFVPPELRLSNQPDLADAIFGWVEMPNWGPKDQRSGRVFFSDATFIAATDGLWYKPEPIIPHVLAEPKPTTFQHYLVQDRNSGHSPDDKASLAHYGSLPA